jgi:hypothetical protein
MITLKEATMYLPYKVQMKISYQGKEKIDTLDLRKAAYLLENSDKWKFQLILRPLDLNKEIEIEDKKFIPIEKLFGVNYSEWDGESETTPACVAHTYNCSKGTVLPKFLPFWVVDQLLEWHFWIGDQSRFGQDVIDINTLK